MRKRHTGTTGIEIAAALAIVALFTYVVAVVKPNANAANSAGTQDALSVDNESRLELGLGGVLVRSAASKPPPEQSGKSRLVRDYGQDIDTRVSALPSRSNALFPDGKVLPQ